MMSVSRAPQRPHRDVAEHPRPGFRPVRPDPVCRTCSSRTRTAPAATTPRCRTRSRTYPEPIGSSMWSKLPAQLRRRHRKVRSRWGHARPTQPARPVFPEPADHRVTAVLYGPTATEHLRGSMPIISVTTWDGQDDAQAQELMNEMMSDHLTGQHMQGMPVMEAGRGRCSSRWPSTTTCRPKRSAAATSSSIPPRPATATPSFRCPRWSAATSSPTAPRIARARCSTANAPCSKTGHGRRAWAGPLHRLRHPGLSCPGDPGGTALPPGRRGPGGGREPGEVRGPYRMTVADTRG